MIPVTLSEAVKAANDYYAEMYAAAMEFGKSKGYDESLIKQAWMIEGLNSNRPEFVMARYIKSLVGQIQEPPVA